MSYKRSLAVVFGCAIAAAVAFAATYPRFFPSAPVHQAPGAQGVASSQQAPLTVEFPPLADDTNPLSWSHLSDAQHEALAPFASEWNTFSDERKRKWIKIAAHFAKMSPEAQKRLHERMTEWVRMTPDQRRVARENYQVSKALPAQARKKAWQAYQELSPEQKAKLAAIGRKRRPTIVSAPPLASDSDERERTEPCALFRSPAMFAAILPCAASTPFVLFRLAARAAIWSLAMRSIVG